MSSYAQRPLLVHFSGGSEGRWRVDSMTAVKGQGLPHVARISMAEGEGPATPGTWTLRGFTSNTRYTTRVELTSLNAKSANLARPEATRAALIPIRKSPAWWALAQDERRSIYEDQSKHTTIGIEYLPQIARRLHHSRDLGEPFDFLTWFEFAPEHEAAFDELLARLRAAKEWTYVEREIDIRLQRDG